MPKRSKKTKTATTTHIRADLKAIPFKAPTKKWWEGNVHVGACRVCGETHPIALMKNHHLEAHVPMEECTPEKPEKCQGCGADCTCNGLRFPQGPNPATESKHSISIHVDSIVKKRNPVNIPVLRNRKRRPM